MGRLKLDKDLRCVSTSLRLRPDRLAKYKEIGGVRWLNNLLDEKLTESTESAEITDIKRKVKQELREQIEQRKMRRLKRLKLKETT